MVVILRDIIVHLDKFDQIELVDYYLCIVDLDFEMVILDIFYLVKIKYFMKIRLILKVFIISF